LTIGELYSISSVAMATYRANLFTRRCATTRFGATVRGGFTLIEAAVVLVIIGVGVTGLVQLIGAGTMAQRASNELTTAIELGNNINEMMQGATYANIKSTYNDVTYSPPKDALGNSLTAFSGWSQSIKVDYVDPNYVATPVPSATATTTARVTVTVSHNSRVIHIAKWLVVQPL
jgi:prepilin-type N-terminal cleavage/methylation domain-containing protein